MDISDKLRSIYNKALENDSKVDKTEFELIKSNILEDNNINENEREFLKDILSSGKLDKGAALECINLFSQEPQDKLGKVKDFFEIAISNDGKVDSKEFYFFKKELLSDNTISDEERNFIIEKLSEGKFDKDTLVEISEILKQENKTEKPKEEVKVEEPKKEEVKKEEPKKQEDKASLEHKISIRGGFNTITVSDGWSQYNSSEKSATRLDGTLEGELNYKNGKHRLNNKVLVEYGTVTTKNEGKKVAKDNQELTSEYTYQVHKNNNFSVELPFVKLFTRGPMTELGNRSFRESTGIKLVYDNKELKNKYSLNLGGGLQQVHDPKLNEWQNKPGLEVVAEGKQRLNFLKDNYMKISNTNQDNLDFLDRIELTGKANVFAPINEGLKTSNMDITLETGAKLFLNKSESVWLGASKQWRYGGKPDSSWEHRVVTDIGFKF